MDIPSQETIYNNRERHLDQNESDLGYYVKGGIQITGNETFVSP